jgi:Bacterial PH domain
MQAQAVHEHEFEATLGLPEKLPAGESIVWQGQPVVDAVVQRVFRWRWVALYFCVLLAWHVGGVRDWSQPMAWRGTIGLALLYGFGVALWWGLAWLTARTTVYTLTTQRVVMRIGIVLTVTYNLPLRCIEAADLHRDGAGAVGGVGDIALRLEPATRIAYLHLWPHARPWHFARPQPMLRCVADATQVAALLSNTWSARHGVAPNPAATAEATVVSATPPVLQPQTQI